MRRVTVRTATLLYFKMLQSCKQLFIPLRTLRFYGTPRVRNAAFRA